MTIPSIPKSNATIDLKIAELRRRRARQYRLVELSTERFRELCVGVLALVMIAFFQPFHSFVGIALFILALGVVACVLVARLFLAAELRQREFQIVLELNERFMKMFNLIGEGILTKPEFVQKATDLVGGEQVARFFERRELENAFRLGNMTTEEFAEKMSLIGYGPEQALEEWQFALWESDPTLRTSD